MNIKTEDNNCKSCGGNAQLKRVFWCVVWESHGLSGIRGGNVRRGTSAVKNHCDYLNNPSTDPKSAGHRENLHWSLRFSLLEFQRLSSLRFLASAVDIPFITEGKRRNNGMLLFNAGWACRPRSCTGRVLTRVTLIVKFPEIQLIKKIFLPHSLDVFHPRLRFFTSLFFCPKAS